MHAVRVPLGLFLYWVLRFSQDVLKLLPHSHFRMEHFHGLCQFKVDLALSFLFGLLLIVRIIANLFLLLRIHTKLWQLRLPHDIVLFIFPYFIVKPILVFVQGILSHFEEPLFATLKALVQSIKAMIKLVNRLRWLSIVNTFIVCLNIDFLKFKSGWVFWKWIRVIWHHLWTHIQALSYLERNYLIVLWR